MIDEIMDASVSDTRVVSLELPVYLLKRQETSKSSGKLISRFGSSEFYRGVNTVTPSTVIQDLGFFEISLGIYGNFLGQKILNNIYLTPFNFRPPLIFGRGWPKIRGAEKV